MGYRNDNDALRAKVEKLEEELAVLKGRKLAERGAHDFTAKVKRQTVLIAIVAALGTIGTGLCGSSIAMGVLFSSEEVTAAQLASPSWHGSRHVEMRVELDASDIVPEDWGTPPEDRYAYSPEAYLIPVAGHPTVLVYCRRTTYGSSRDQCELAADAASALDGDDEARRRIARPHEIRGTVHDIDYYGYGFYELDHADLVGYATQRGFNADALRVVSVEPSRESEVLPLIVIAAILAAFSLLLWFVLLAHRALSRRAVELPTPADLMSRDPVMVIVLSILSCGLYELYWQYATTLQLRRLTGRPDLQPGLDLVLNILTLRFWTYWVAYRNAEAIDDAMSDMGEHSSHKTTALLMGLLSWTCGLLYWAMLYKQQEGMNQLFLEKMSRDELDAPEEDQNT